MRAQYRSIGFLLSAQVPGAAWQTATIAENAVIAVIAQLLARAVSMQLGGCAATNIGARLFALVHVVCTVYRSRMCALAMRVLSRVLCCLSGASAFDDVSRRCFFRRQRFYGADS
ncbi:MAG: hypothetical protein ACI8W7_001625 [Gammaproteobacteria bacterium]|jgi:hypothetical protein